jgi:ferric-dicitrate binding protein FerR (iron transport regulator)
MDEITSPVSEPVSPEFAAIDAYLTDALRVPPLDTEAAQVMAQAVMRRGGSRIRESWFRNQILRLGSQPLRPWLSVMAGIALILLGYGTVQRGLFQRADVSALRVATYTTGNGERAKVTLTDGTAVMLDVASRLEVPADYATGNQVVSLTGAAYFSVPHHGSAPFTVRTPDTDARVLGTTFVVRRYATDTMTTIAVRDGRVAVRSLVISGGQQAQVSRTRTGPASELAPEQFGFVTGLLTLKQMPMPQAVEELGRWYNADIRLGDTSVRSIPVNGQFGLGSLSDLSEILALTYHLKVVRAGRTLTLYAK